MPHHLHHDDAERPARATTTTGPTCCACLCIFSRTLVQGLHELALRPIDAALGIQPDHWQTHLMRLHCLRALERLHAAEAAESHENVCHHLQQAAIAAGRRAAYRLLCEETEQGERVRLLGADASSLPPSVPPKASARRRSPPPQPAGRGVFGWHLTSSAARRKLAADRYVVLRKLLPPDVVALLQGWYGHLDEVCAAAREDWEIWETSSHWSVEVIPSTPCVALTPQVQAQVRVLRGDPAALFVLLRARE